ncbi:MAG: hypothetical protein ACOCU2_00045 [Bacillota bacterium]
MPSEWLNKLRETADKAIERTKAEIEKFREPNELEDALDKFEQDIKDLEARQVELTKEQQEVKVKLEQKKHEKKLAIKKLKKMKN